MTKNAYCPKCDKEVETVEVSIGAEGESATRCSECGNTLAQTSPRDNSVETNKKRIVVCGYSPVQSDIMAAAFVRNGFANELITCSNGEEFLVNVINCLKKKKRPNLIITEVQMPIMNGINASICMRSIEKGVSREKIPLLFFTSKPLEDQFVRAIKFLTPAKYVPLPPKADLDTFRQRVEQIVDLLKKENW